MTCGDDHYYFYNALYSSGWGLDAGGIGIGTGADYYNNSGQPTTTAITKTVARMFVWLSDGSRHELRKDDTVYSGFVSSFTGKYYSVDGSRLIYDTSNSTLYLPDGSHFAAGTYTDSQGNTMVYGTSGMTDTLGRTISGPFSVATGESGTADADTTYSIPGFGSGTVDYQMHWRKLSDTGIISSDETDQTLRYKGDATGSCTPMTSGLASLFPSQDVQGEMVMKQGAVFNPVVLSQIELPNGQTYTFKYNVYGEIVKIIYPTGAYERFEYTAVPGISGWFDDSFFAQTNRGVVHRWVSSDGTSASEVEYSYSAGLVTNPDGTKTQYVYYSKPNEVIAYGFDNPLYGKINEVRQYSSTGDLMSRNLTEWTVDGTVGSTYGGTEYLTRNPRVVREISIVFEPGATNALASMTTIEYDSNSDPEYFANLNVKRKKAFDYVSVTASTAASALLSTATGWFSSANPAVVTEIDYLYDSNYKARNMNSLVTEIRIQDASGNVKAKTHFTYDEVGTYPIIAAGTNAQWTDPSTNYRGHPTTVRTWSDIAGNQYVDTHAQYDNFGNLRKAWDGNGNLAQTDYSSTYGYAYPTSVTTPVPDSTGTYGSSSAFTTTSVYDFNTALPTSVADANSQTTTMEYDDALLRPTKTTAPNGAQTITEYGAGTSASTLWVKVKSQIDDTNWKEGYKYFDGLGRTIRTQSVDPVGGDEFTLACYDNMGRVSKATNPFRGYSTQTCSTTTGLDWTTNTFDAAGRPWKVTTPDSAVIETTYSLAATSGYLLGTVTTVTDQADKQRRSITNALGQLVRLDEPDPDPGRSSDRLGSVSIPNQPTFYGYDTLNNLTSVQQDGTTVFQCTGKTAGSPTSCNQSRSFTYDALSRLKSATNPESGTINYTYDANGNLATKVDARSITTTYSYDRLNRVYQRSYSGGSGYTTPTVNYYYDNLTNATGKLTKVTSSVSTTEYTSFDILGHVTASKQTTDGVTYGNGTTDSPMTYTYNLGGALVEQQYPSGRVVKNVLDQNGDLAMVEAKKNSSSGYWSYANSFTYNAARAVTSMQLGNGRWESTVFNSRLQPTHINLGTTQGGADKLNLVYGYGTTANNGNVLTQTITVPGLTPTFNQSYTYDSLNRLGSAAETYNGSQTWKQEFSYDRYGNRNFVAGSGHTTTIPSGCGDPVCNPTVSATNNRLTSSGYSYDSAGNTTADAESRAFTYDGENKQVEVSDGTGVIGQYYYDGDGKRVKKIGIAPGSTDHELTIFVYDAAGRQVAEYSTVVANSTDAKVDYLTNDHLGSPRINTDANGAVISRHDYHPFGEEIVTSQRTTGLNYGDDTIRKQFTGYEDDVESKLDKAGMRYFNSSHGRFTTADPYNIVFQKEKGCTDRKKGEILHGYLSQPQNWNQYAYVLDNPSNLKDPSGLIYLRHHDGSVHYIEDDTYYKNSIADPYYYDKLGFVGIVKEGSVTTVGKGATGIFAKYKPGTAVILGEDGQLTPVLSIGEESVTVTADSGEMISDNDLSLANILNNPHSEAEKAQSQQFKNGEPFNRGDPYNGAYRHCVAACLLAKRFGDVGHFGRKAWDWANESSGAKDSPGDMDAETIGEAMGTYASGSCEVNCLIAFPSR